MEPIGYPETSARNYQYSLPNNPEGSTFSSNSRRKHEITWPSFYCIRMASKDFDFVRSWVYPRAIMRPAEIYNRKIPMTPWGIESETLGFVAQCLRQLRHRVPPILHCTTLYYTKLHYTTPYRSIRRTDYLRPSSYIICSPHFAKAKRLSAVLIRHSHRSRTDTLCSKHV